MSQARRQKRAGQRLTEKLYGLLISFYDFLDQKPQPSDEEVRETFKKHSLKWHSLCDKAGIGDQEKARELFKKEVRAAWEKRYAKKEEKENSSISM